MKILWWGLILAASVHGAEPADVTSAQFAEKAYAALPVEQPYLFHKQLSGWVEPLRRNPDATLAPGELEIPRESWSLIIPSQAGVVLRTAATEFRDYLRLAMQVRIELREEGSVSGWRAMGKAIVAGTRDQLSGCSSGLAGRKDYQIATARDRIMVCGFDERGAMYGLYNLEGRMNLREAPYLPAQLDTVRHSLYKARMTLSGLGWMEWPDA